MDNMNYILAENKHGKYAVPASSQERPACKVVIGGDVYEPDTIQFMVDNCGDGVIIHAGTFFGDFLPALMKTGNKVYAFEPVKENYEHARETINLNQIEGSGVLLYHAALGSKIERLPIATTDAFGTSMGGGSRFGYNKNTPEIVTEMATVMALDLHVAEQDNVSIIQLDVEGFEEEALKGAMDIIRASKPILILEIWSPNVLQRDFFKDEIFSMGYVWTENVHDNMVLRMP
jgi:FkbM family methyltransferase